ncbi:uncharacterized protein B0I36DRAFT_400494 [Microdochium trichocladiopsis]|uniref:NACHT-NTPase sigma domain-containing protein n=1 Tax=Microdochium trichocladiopsis TaxID=1682393 RepID=A0A9P8XTW1_9PEZI|nr:uncharacterized protein B0I36DRAFT_400494 [Microdochium trichocladiopsis]KAH7012313.1 hypothetical protein B0I36DRAFT_400494 [Microdochium trichocladiopsis]
MAPETHQQDISRNHGPPSPPSPHDRDPGLSSQCPAGPSSFPDGVEVLHDCHDATVDICFVHGLTGDRDSTWTANGQSRPWPATLLPPNLGRARILTYAYDAYVLRKSPASVNALVDYAQNLLNDLTTDRACSVLATANLCCPQPGRPRKEAILLSRNNPNAHLRGIFDCTKAIAFMGTPHRGSWMAHWARIPASALGLVKSSNNSLLKSLQTAEDYLRSVQDRFWSMVRERQQAGRDVEVTCFSEELPLPVIGLVVPSDSATLESYNAITIHANHSNMVKFSSADDNGFKRVLGELIRWESQIWSSAVSQPTQSKGDTQPTHPLVGPGDQFNAPGGTQNISKGSGSQFPGANFSGSVQFGK